MIPCLLVPDENGPLRKYLSADDRFEDDTEVPKWVYPWDDTRVNQFTIDRKRLDQECDLETEFPKDIPVERLRMHPEKLARRRELFAAVVEMLRSINRPDQFCKNIWEAQKWLGQLHNAHFDYLHKLRRRIT